MEQNKIEHERVIEEEAKKVALLFKYMQDVDDEKIKKMSDVLAYVHSLGITQGIEMVEKALPGNRIMGEEEIYTWLFDEAEPIDLLPSNMDIKKIIGWNTYRSEVKQIISNLKKQ